MDPNQLPPDFKAELIAVGERFSSEDTYNQANDTLDACVKYGSMIAPHGFSDSDRQDLATVRDLLSAAGVGREQAKEQKKKKSAGAGDALKEARTARIRGRAVLQATYDQLRRGGAKEAAQVAKVVLDATASADSVGEELAGVLDRIAAALSDASVAPAAAGRGGPETVKALSDAALALRGVTQLGAHKRGTPAETQWLDLLDGLVVGYVRSARDAAESASKALGDRAMLEAFKLDRLYPAAVKVEKKKEGGGGPTGPTGPTG